MRHFALITLLLAVFNLTFAQTDHTSKNWTATIDGVGIFSSPRVTDLNGDGIGDVIFGTGRVEFH